MYQSITSRDNAHIKRACLLAASAGARREEGRFFAEGRRLCFDLAQSAKPRAAFFTQQLLAACPEAAHMADEAFLVADHVADKLSTTRHSQGLYCLFDLPQAGAAALAPGEGLLLCDAVQDPVNVGAMLRSAAAFGFGGVLLLPGCADPFSPRALRSSMGAVLRVPVAGMALEGAAAFLKQAGVPLYAAALQGAHPLAETQPGGPFALAVGSEGAGLSPGLLALAQQRVFIPMQRGVESLNAAVAASVLMHHFKAGQAPAGH